MKTFVVTVSIEALKHVQVTACCMESAINEAIEIVEEGIEKLESEDLSFLDDITIGGVDADATQLANATILPITEEKDDKQT
jgi:hypothetical protein